MLLSVSVVVPASILRDNCSVHRCVFLTVPFLSFANGKNIILFHRSSAAALLPLYKKERKNGKQPGNHLSLSKWPHENPGSPLERAQCYAFGTSFEQLAMLSEHGVHKGPGSKDNHHKLFRRNVAPKYPFATLVFLNGVTNQ